MPAREFGAGARACLPIVLGYVLIGAAFGVVARTAGLSVLEITLMSLILYAGSAQFVVTGLLASGASAGAIIVTVFLVNIRHLLYSAALAPHIRRLRVWQAMLLGVELTDETFAVASAQLHSGRTPGAAWFYGLNVTAQSTWVLATALGALVGAALPDTRTLGLDFALTAMFAALLVLQILQRVLRRPAVAVAIIGATVALGGTLIMPATWAVIMAALAAASAGALLEKKR